MGVRPKYRYVELIDGSTANATPDFFEVFL